ncbi:hypothetical protein ACFFLZ_13690 [Photobacterium aphoticum]|uniref:hypothetical protein n=1 Tax=Photobacterium aphoticum TaxID=754436 RepID=UPI000A63A25C|nr:hypothetical protein [Photobacterium aphoticum]
MKAGKAAKSSSIRTTRVAALGVLAVVLGGQSVFTAQAAQEDVPYCHRYADFNFPDYMAMWNYDDPALTATTFFAMLNMAASSMDKTFMSELLSQISRTYLMQGDMHNAQYYLEQAQMFLDHAEPRAEVYFQRETARWHATQGDHAQATEWMLKAWQLAKQEQYAQLMIETALDLGDGDITRLSDVEQQAWHLRAKQIAENTQDQRAQMWVMQHAARFH